MIELNEAFAGPAGAVADELGLDPERINVDRSGILLGHPIGATGATVKAWPSSIGQKDAVRSS